MDTGGGGGGLSVQPLVAAGSFNWVFLVEILVCGILALFFLFYFNRLFATIIAYCIRAWTWHKYRAYIDISALQISLLGGRIFFKSIHYHAHNVTVLVYEGHVTWRYWLRLVQDAEVFAAETAGVRRTGGSFSSQDGEKRSSGDRKDSRSRSIGKEEVTGGKAKKELPCRISVTVSGVEAFVYNRSPVYDMILEQTQKKGQTSFDPFDASKKQDTSSSSETGKEQKPAAFAAKPKRSWPNGAPGSDPVAQTVSHEGLPKPQLPAFLRMLPVRIDCRRAAAAVGNESTTSVLVAKLDKAAGTIDAGHAGPLDLYKLLFDFDMDNINVTLKPNRDFKQLQHDAARRILREKEVGRPPSISLATRYLRKITRRWHKLTNMLASNKSVNASLRTASMRSQIDVVDQDQTAGMAQWHGLARYMDDKNLDEHDQWKDVEYAKASTLADIEKLNFRFYFDIPGKVPDVVVDGASSTYAEDLNGSKPPEYGMDFHVHGGVVTYGPWTDRQRINLQQIFFPASYIDATPTTPLKPGDTRNWSLFNIFVLIEKDVTLRIPSREPSKDDKWQGRAARPAEPPDQGDLKWKHKHGKRHRSARRRKDKQGNARTDARPYAWLDVTVKTDSTVSYVMDMFSRESGYVNKLECDIRATEIASSVNHGLLWRTGAVSLSADLSQPASWNSLRDWPFDITIDGLELFILRDHMFLIIDLVNDWSYGPPSDFFTFVPYIYRLRMLFRTFVIYLNVNDANIVNDSANLDRNDILTLEGTLDATLDINMDKYRPVRNMITFDVLATDMRMRMLSSSRNTVAEFLKDKVVADLPKLTLSGSYSGHLEERPGLTDTLRFDIIGSGLTLKAYGFLVRQLINVKENYFGDYMHFKTLEEFQAADDDLTVANIKTASLPKPKSINELDVVLCIIAEDVTVLLPTNIYSCEEFVRAELPVANLDLRIVSYYLDMGLQLSPLSFMSGSSSRDDDGSSVESDTATEMFVKHVDLDGHRAFGLPPNEPAYLNQWSIDIGAITGELSSSFIHDLAMAGRAFVFGFADRENMLPVPSPSVFSDITFVQVRTDIVRLWLHAGKDAILLSALPVEVLTNDWAGDTFSQRVNVSVPEITLSCVDARSASRQRGRDQQKSTVATHAFFQTGVSVDVVLRKLHFEEEKLEQQKHIRVQDLRTKRAVFLRRDLSSTSDPAQEGLGVEPPAMPYPVLPVPLGANGSVNSKPASIRSVSSFRAKRGLGSRSSNSSNSSLSGSIRTASLAQPSNNVNLAPHAPAATLSNPRLKTTSSISSLDSAESAANRREHDQRPPGVPSTGIAFSSSFVEPYFPLEDVQPDESQVPILDLAPDVVDAESMSSSRSEMIEDSTDDGDFAQTSVIITVTPGIRAYATPRIVSTALKVFRKVLPKQPDEVMDSFQMDVLGQVAAEQAQRTSPNSTLEIRVDLPVARLRVANSSGEASDDDQLDVALHHVEALIRTRSTPQADDDKHSLAVHVVVDRVEASLGSLSQLASNNPPLRIQLDDILLWIAMQSSQSVNASVGDTSISVVGEQAEYVANLALRLLPVLEKLKAKLDETINLNRQRLILMIRTLIDNSEVTGEPPFLSRITHLLRAFPDHFRNNDSWKILVRLRHILYNMPASVRDEWQRQSKALKAGPLALAPLHALEEWTSFRNWDVPNVHQTKAFQYLAACEDGKVMRSAPSKPLIVAVRSELLRLAVTSYGEPNELVLEDTTVGLNQTPPTAPTGLMLLDENTRTKTVLQVHAASIALAANWSAFKIAQHIVPLAQRLQTMAVPLAKQTSRSSSVQHMDYGLTRHVFHIVLSVSNGSISLKTINLRHLSRTEGLKLSVIGTTRAEEPYGPVASAILNATAAVTELHGPTQCIWQTNLTSPSVYLDHLQPRPDADVPPSVTAAVSYKELGLGVLEPVTGILQLINAVIVDEVAQIMTFVNKVQPMSAQTPSTIGIDASGRDSVPPKVHLALLAGQLRVQLSLLHALTYQLQGTAASVRVAPSLTKERQWTIDYDVGRQTHCFINSSSARTTEQNILDVPPINGHIGLQLDQNINNLSVATTMDRVEIDAAAIQGMVTLVNRPEVQNVIRTIRHGMQSIQSHVEEVVPKRPAHSMPRQEKKQIAYEVRLVLLGVRVSAITPVATGSSTAEVEFGVGPIYAISSNKATFESDKSLLPEVRAQVRDIGAKLSILTGGEREPCGNLTFSIDVHFRCYVDDRSNLARELKVLSRGFDIKAYPETASVAVDVVNHLQDRIKDLDLSTEKEYLRHLRDSRRQTVVEKFSGKKVAENDGAVGFSAEDLLSVTTTVELADIKVAWLVPTSYAAKGQRRVSDLVLTLDRIEFTTRGGHEARLALEDLQLQLAPRGKPLAKRSLNSALLTEVSFTVAYWSANKKRSIALRAAGKPLEINLESKFLVPVDAVQKSITDAVDKFKVGTATWKSTPTSSGRARAKMIDTKFFSALLLEADFAGAQVYIQGSGPQRDRSLSVVAASSQQQGSRHGRYGQFAAEGAQMQTTLRAPGIAMKVEYHSHTEGNHGTVNGEVQVEASSNMLLPNVVPLLLEISNGAKEIMQKPDEPTQTQKKPSEDTKPGPRFFEEESIITADPSAIFGRTRVNLGLRIDRQEFGLTCQPIARVDAKAQLDDFYVTMNTIESAEHGHFFAISAVVTKLTTQVKHVYSREPTFSFDMDSINLSVLNSKHLSGTSGISAVLKINPTRMFVNGKQLQDLLLFREIWVPPEIRASRSSSPPPPQATSGKPEEFFAQKYRNVASSAAFPWNATISIAELAVDLDLGQSIGKSSFTITNLWASQAKSSDWEQNLCIGMDCMAMNGTGRMSGFIQLDRLGVRTAIKWPEDVVAHRRTPQIQASIGFQRLRAKAAFDYQAFAFGDIEGFDFMMYNVHEEQGSARDRLVAILDCEKAYVFCTSTSPAQAVGLYQAFDRLIQEKQQAYVNSLKDIEKHLRRESTFVPTRFGPSIPESPIVPRSSKNTISLHTDVVLTIGTISAGVYPSTFFDSQILKLEANNIQARFAVGVERRRIQSGLGMTLGQLQVALASVRRATAVPRALDVSVEDVISNAVNAKGGTILRVPKVVASMQTWQDTNSNNVDYIFKSLFAGKIDVGWNLSRIDFIKNMWVAHSRSLAARLGKALPESAVKITAQPATDGEAATSGDKAKPHEKITAEVNLPQSKYEYHALEPPIIETPQLRDMGEATPPLEWIGLHRDRLPNVTHQIIIVSLLEVAKEVEDAYGRILGSSS